VEYELFAPLIEEEIDKLLRRNNVFPADQISPIELMVIPEDTQ